MDTGSDLFIKSERVKKSNMEDEWMGHSETRLRVMKEKENKQLPDNLV